MHHEVLLALSGYPGHTFAVSRESGLFEVIQYSRDYGTVNPKLDLFYHFFCVS